MPKKRQTPFKVGDLIVYPAHGVGRISAIQAEILYGEEIELICIQIENEGLTLKVPKHRVAMSGMRPLADPETSLKALEMMRKRPRGKTGTWSRRAQEYEKKINSGDLILAAEVVRDLRAKSGSYSERMIYERALGRVSREIGPVLGQDPDLIRSEVEAFQERVAA